MKSLLAFTILLSSLTLMGQRYHTEFEYPQKGITIKNSYPKGGQKYTAPEGQEYVYVTFWTCIANDTASNLELEIDFPADSFAIPSSPDINFNVYIPKDEMTLEKESLPNYGLDIISFLEEHIHAPSQLKTVLKPYSSHLLYTVITTNKGVNGTIRVAFELKNDDLIYTINNYEINCGNIIAKKQ